MTMTNDYFNVELAMVSIVDELEHFNMHQSKENLPFYKA